MLRGLVSQVQGRRTEAVNSVNEIVALVNQSIENARSLARELLPVRSETAIWLLRCGNWRRAAGICTAWMLISQRKWHRN